MTSVLPPGVGDCDRLRNGIMSVAAEDDVNSGDAAGELQVHVHSVMGQKQHGVDLVHCRGGRSTTFCNSSSRMPKVQSGTKRLGWAIGT